MAEERIVRRLPCILAADVVGYSRMMRAGELERIRHFAGPSIRIDSSRLGAAPGAHRQADGRRHAGPVADDAVEAVACAAEIQRELAARNRDASRKMGFSHRCSRRRRHRR